MRRAKFNFHRQLFSTVTCENTVCPDCNICGVNVKSKAYRYVHFAAETRGRSVTYLVRNLKVKGRGKEVKLSLCFLKPSTTP
jgi:hypothetical protein